MMTAAARSQTVQTGGNDGTASREALVLGALIEGGVLLSNQW